MTDQRAASTGLDVDTAVAAWEEFCESLKGAAAVLRRDDLEPDGFDLGEGLRYLARLTQAGLTSFLEAPGPRHPEFTPLPGRLGFGLDNPDNVYASASVDPAHDYVIRGRRGTITYLSLAAQNQNYAARDRITGGAGHLRAGDLDVGPDGRFEVVASTREHPGSWLRLAPDTSMILARQTFAAPDEVAAELEIECLGVDEHAPPLDPASVPNALLGATLFAAGASSWFADWVAPWRSEPNRLHVPDAEHHRLVGGDPNIAFQLGYWSLAADEALVVEVTPPRCDYWNFQLGNVWSECLDKRRSIARNIADATYEPDGSVRLVVAHRDPGHPNWLDTGGHRHGIMGMRWVVADDHPRASTRVVPVDAAADS